VEVWDNIKHPEEKNTSGLNVTDFIDIWRSKEERKKLK